jgi:hypothetical protein
MLEHMLQNPRRMTPRRPAATLRAAKLLLASVLGPMLATLLATAPAMSAPPASAPPATLARAAKPAPPPKEASPTVRVAPAGRPATGTLRRIPGELHGESFPAVPVVRDWAQAPVIAEHTPRGPVYAASDLHGRYDEALALFRGNGLVRTSAGGAIEWTGKNATLVVVGDVINKGPGSVELIDLLRALQTSAEKSGGKVIVTMGNHEALFLSDPLSERSLRDGTGGKNGLGGSLLKRGIDPSQVAAGVDPEGRGAWLRALPFAARVGDAFFLHSGSTNGRGAQQITSSIQNALEHGGFGHRVLVGESPRSLLGAEHWEGTVAAAKQNAERLGVKRIVMGHVPKALDALGEIAATADGTLVKLDTGLGDAEGPPRLARFDANGRLRQLGPSGERTTILHAHAGL